MTEFTLDAASVAPLLGLTPQRFLALFKRGLIRQRVERGVGEDSGRYRVTLRYLAREARIVIDPDGVPVENPSL